jgi:type I restriction enzyme R subunit
MSQVVDFGDPYMEMLSIFLRLLAKVIADSSWSVEVDLSEVFLVGVPGVSIVRTVTNAVVAGRLLDVRG